MDLVCCRNYQSCDKRRESERYDKLKELDKNKTENEIGYPFPLNSIYNFCHNSDCLYQWLNELLLFLAPSLDYILFLTASRSIPAYFFYTSFLPLCQSVSLSASVYQSSLESLYAPTSLSAISVPRLQQRVAWKQDNKEYSGVYCWECSWDPPCALWKIENVKSV